MERRAVTVVTGLIFISVYQLLSASAMGALGDKVSFPDQDSSALSASGAGVSIKPSYAVKEMVAANSRVREYVGRDGVVFGVAWSGRNHPDFSSLLGSFFTEFKELHQRKVTWPSGIKVRGSRRTLEGAHLVVERFGHMGAIRGRAFVPVLLPQGVSANEIR